jgi:hypothetical protein
MLTFGRLMQAGVKFIVAGRYYKGAYKDISALDLPEVCRGMFIELPDFDIALSSTDIREGRTGTGL